MGSQNYKEIRDKFNRFVEAWSTRDSSDVNEYVHPWISAYLSTSIKMANGSQASIFGIRDFINDFPKTDSLKTEIRNYTCRVNNDYAVTYALVICRAENNDGRFFTFEVMTFVEWIKENDEWLMRVMRIDVKPEEGNLREEFEKSWFFEKQSAVLSGGVHLPCIRSEFDTPWDLIKNNEVISDEREVIADVLNQFNFGIDFIRFDYCYKLTTEDFNGYGLSEDDNYITKEDCLSMLKYQRQRSRHNVSPYDYNLFNIDNNKATVKGRNLFTNKHYEINLRKEEDNWRICSWLLQKEV